MPLNIAVTLPGIGANGPLIKNIQAAMHPWPLKAFTFFSQLAFPYIRDNATFKKSKGNYFLPLFAKAMIDVTFHLGPRSLFAAHHEDCFNMIFI